jgi:excisionase family DNA binding protein
MALNVKQAATRLRVPRAVIYEMCRSGMLTHHRVSGGRGKIFIDEEDLKAAKQTGIANVDIGPILGKGHYKLFR